MSLRCILVPTHSADGVTARWNAALRLSRRMQAHIRTLFIRRDPELLYRDLPDILRIGGVTPEQVDIEGRAEAARSCAAFEQWRLTSGLPSGFQIEDLQTPFGSWGEQIGAIEPVVALAGRVSDLIVVDRPTQDDVMRERIFDAAVFSTGRPTLMVGDRVPDDLLRHVVIAWNGSLEASRLVGHAITLLHAADRVSIVTVPSPRNIEAAASDLHDYLVWHGIRARQVVAAANPGSVGESILDTASQLDATLILMGAYTHSRLRQMFLGGVTRHMLDRADIPILMEH